MRNYAILKIADSESRIFLTKERAPFMICLEAYRPYEEMKYDDSVLREHHARHSTAMGEFVDRILFKKPKSI